MLEGWVKNGDIRIHYIDNTGPSTEPPLVIIPGLTETGEEYEDILRALAPRRALVITMRGRGRSDAPEMGYTLEDHVTDIESVINHIHIENFVLFGFHRGVVYALGFAMENLSRLKGLIIGDYPAVETDLPKGWANLLVQKTGRTALTHMTLDTLKAIEHDSHEQPFWKQLGHVNCPVLVLRGSQEGIGLTEEGAKEYLRSVPGARVKTITDGSSGSFNLESQELLPTLKQFFEEAKKCRN